MKTKPRPTRKAVSAPPPVPHRYLPLLLVAIVAATYINSLGLGLAMDGAVLVRDDPRLEAATAENVGRILTGPYWWGNPSTGLFRPITTLSFLVNYSVFGNGENGPGYHVVNLLLHLANSLMVFALVRRMPVGLWVAWFAAALWAVHPAGVESVTNVAGRGDLFASAAVLGGLLWYIRRSRSDAVTIAVLLAIGLAGVFAKESAAVLPGVLLLWDLAFGAKRPLRFRLISYAAATVPAVVFLVTRLWFPRMHVPLLDNPAVAADFVTARLTALKVIGQYLLLMIWPIRLSSDYSYNQVALARPWDLTSWLAPLAIAAILAAVVWRKRRDPVLFFAAGWFGLTLLPVSNLLFVIGSIKAERFLYLPAVGFGIAAAVLGERAMARWSGAGRSAPAIVAAVALAFFAFRSAARNPEWNDDLALFTANLQAAPASYKVHKGLATALFEQDAQRNLDEATRHLETALNIVKDVPLAEQPADALTDLGVCYRMQGDRVGVATAAGRAWNEKALAVLLRAHEVDRIYERRMTAAERARGAEVTKVYGSPPLYMNLGNVYLNLGNTDAALEACRYGRLLSPTNPNFYVSLAAVHLARKDTASAAMELLRQYLIGVHDPQTGDRLRSLYAQIPGGQCAFGETGRTLSFNLQCPRFKNDLCAAGADVVKILMEARRPSEAAERKAEFQQRYGCLGPA